jgi:acyl-CoA synthetase (AMP-forming)/AMP-acid ligase II
MTAPISPQTLVDFVSLRAEQFPDRVAYRFLETGDADGPTTEWSFARLRDTAAAVAARLRAEGWSGERVLLLYAPGVDFVGACVGCLAAGAVAVR